MLYYCILEGSWPLVLYRCCILESGGSLVLYTCCILENSEPLVLYTCCILEGREPQVAKESWDDLESKTLLNKARHVRVAVPSFTYYLYTWYDPYT